MTTRPPNNGPDPREDPDPTGMRALLGSLPDPGPMPQEVSASITEALAQEQSRREADGRDTSNVRALGSARSRTPIGRLQRTVISLGAAAAVAAVAVVGVNALQNRQAPTTAAPTMETGQHQSSLEDKVVVESTGTNYTKKHLATEAAAMTRHTGPTLSPQQVKKIGDMATRSGVVACMNSIGASMLDEPDKISVDIARYQGDPAVIVVLTKGKKSTVWVVSRSCTTGTPPIAGPTTFTA